MHVSGNIKGPQLKSFLLDFTQENTYSFRIKKKLHHLPLWKL